MVEQVMSVVHGNSPRLRFWLLTLWGIASHAFACMAYWMAARTLDEGFALRDMPAVRQMPVWAATLILAADVGPACLYAFFGWKTFGIGSRFLLTALHEGARER